MTLQAIPYLIMDGDAKEAIQFYKQAIGAEILTVISYGEMPQFPNDELKDLIAHAKLRIGKTELMISDSPGIPIQSGNQVTICITSKSATTSWKIYDALRIDGRVNAPMEVTSFSPGFGNVTDKFGVTFQILTENEN